MNECYSCVHRKEVPGSAHSACANTNAKVSADPYGVKSGWFAWPVNFDPVWLDSCDGYKSENEENKENSVIDTAITLGTAIIADSIIDEGLDLFGSSSSDTGSTDSSIDFGGGEMGGGGGGSDW